MYVNRKQMTWTKQNKSQKKNTHTYTHSNYDQFVYFFYMNQFGAQAFSKRRCMTVYCHHHINNVINITVVIQLNLVHEFHLIWLDLVHWPSRQWLYMCTWASNYHKEINIKSIAKKNRHRDFITFCYCFTTAFITDIIPL